MLKHLVACSKIGIPLVLGICIGIALSFVVLPFIEEQNCEWNPKHSIHSGNSVISNGHRERYLRGIDWDSFRSAEYEPNVVESKPAEAQPAKKPHRHRFIQSEIHMKETLFIGYLTSVQEIYKRGAVLNKTVSRPQGNEQAMKLFLDSSGQPNLQVNSHRFPSLVLLNLLDSSTLPLIAIKYLASNTRYYNRYKYYMLIPDTVYPITTQLMEYVEQLNGEPVIGFPSRTDSKICDPYSGFIMSQVCSQIIC